MPAFFKSGFRYALLWLMHEPVYAGQPVDELMRRAKAVGDDLAGYGGLIARVLRQL